MIVFDVAPAAGVAVLVAVSPLLEVPDTAREQRVNEE